MGADLGPFSSRQTGEGRGLLSFNAMAALRPAGPPPTMTTSNSIASRSILPLRSTWPEVVLVVYVNVNHFVSRKVVTTRWTHTTEYEG